MISRTNRFVSLVMMVAMLFSTASFTLAFDEGMYAPGQIAKLPNLKNRGLKIKPEEIYNPAGGGLTEAVVRLDSGCTAELVSPDGLILTNHHCAFDALVKNSTPAKDLVETGFNAGSRAGEIQAPDFSITLTHRIEDVTERIRAGTSSLTGEAFIAATKKNTDDLTAAEQAKAPKGHTVRIQGIASGYFYYLYQTSQVNDIRVVYAPPRNIGVFGGDPDNFEWSRHTGDFAFLRAYVAPDGSPAKYSANNVPYKPKKFLTMNIGGLKEDDFVFVLGFPGGTTRYRESWSMQYARDANFPFLAAWLRTLGDTLRMVGANDEEKRIALQSDIANFDNSRKVYEGGALRLRLAQAVQQREAEEARLSTWIAADPVRQTKYGSILPELKALSAETNAAQNRDALMRRFPDPNSMVVFPQLVTAVSNTKTLSDAERADLQKKVEAAYKTREPLLEIELLKFFLRSLDELPTDQKFKPAEDLFGTLQGRARRDAEAKFADSIVNGEYSSPAKVVGLYGPRTMEYLKEREDILTFARGVVAERQALTARSTKFAASIDRLRIGYMSALNEMRGTAVVYPDANFTMRFSFGNIKGYSPREAEFRTPFTTIKGIVEKNTGINPFDAPQKLIDLQRAKDFGRYGEGDSVVVNFLSSTDIIGGNSGSPILNGNGEQVGICFDGNFEGLGNDFYFDPNTNRTISVDIRYVLFVTEKFGGAKWVVDEMKVVGRK